MPAKGYIHLFGVKFDLQGRNKWWVLPVIPVIIAILFAITSLVYYGICELTGVMEFSRVNCIWFFIVIIFFAKLMKDTFNNDGKGD